MAEAREEVPEENSEKYLLICQPCKDFKEEKQAEGFCETCQEHLCDTCFKAHTRARASRNHVIRDKTQMPMSTVERTENLKEHQLCAIHCNQDLTSYCKMHDALCCERCVDLSHAMCQDVKSLNEIAVGIQESEEYKAFEGLVRHISEQNKVNISQSIANERKIYDLYNACANGFSETVVKIKDSDLSKNELVQNTSQSIKTRLEEFTNGIKQRKENKRNDLLFTLMKTSKKELDLINLHCYKMFGMNTIERYRFVPGENNHTIGTIVKVPHLLKRMNIKHSSEKCDCRIVDMLLLGNGRLMVIDYSGNDSVKLLDVVNNEILKQKTCQQHPQRMAKDEMNRVYVTTSSNNKILMFSDPLSDFEKVKELFAERFYYTIACYAKSLIVECILPTRLLELDMGGKTKRTLVADITALKNDRGEKILTSPSHAVVNNKRNVIAYTDYIENTLVEVDINGKVRQVVKSPDLGKPCGIAVDGDGSYIVCSEKRRSVLRVSATGTVTELIGHLGFEPRSIALDAEKKLLYIGGLNCNAISVYRI